MWSNIGRGISLKVHWWKSCISSADSSFPTYKPGCLTIIIITDTCAKRAGSTNLVLKRAGLVLPVLKPSARLKMVHIAKLSVTYV